MTLAERNILGLFLVTGAAVLAGIALFDPVSLISVAVFPAICGGLALMWGVIRGNRFAVFLYLFAAIFLVQAVFRIRDYQDKDVDFQVILKIVIWISVAGVALFHVRRWFRILIDPINYPWILFLLWIFATTIVAQVPAYTAASAFTVIACVIFAAYQF